MSIWEDMTEIKDINADKILSQLLAKKKKKYHTEIHNPVSISTLEIIAEHYKDLGIKPLIKNWLSEYRTNMIAFNRQRAKEIVDAYKSKVEAEAKAKSLHDVMLGK